MTITLRKVKMSDASLLLKWKNEADTRANSIVTGAHIKMVNHLKWLKAALKDPAISSFDIILVDGKAVGDVRVNWVIGKGGNMEKEISIRMDKKCRGRGLATQVIAMFDSPMTAKIRVHNVASMRVFIANGYRPEEYIAEPAPYLIFRK